MAKKVVVLVVLAALILAAIGYLYLRPTPISTLTSAPTPTGTWHVVKEFAGSSGTKTSGPFYVEGEYFKVTWVVSTNREAAIKLFTCDIYPKGETRDPIKTIVYGRDGEEETFVYAGPGYFYLDVNALGIDVWTIRVESYH